MTLTSYTLDAVDYGNGDYTVTLTFDDNSTVQQTLHDGQIHDDPQFTTDENGNQIPLLDDNGDQVIDLAVDQLNVFVMNYAQSYINGLQIRPQLPTPPELEALIGQQTDVAQYSPPVRTR